MKSMFGKIKFLIVTALIVLTVSVSWLGTAQLVSAQTTDAEFDSKINDLKTKVEGINTQLGNTTTQITEAQDRKNTLAAEISSLQSDIQKLDGLISQTQKAIDDVEKEIDSKQKEVEKLKLNTRDIYRLIQQNQTNSFVEVILSSESLDQIIAKLNSLTTLQNELDKLQAQIKKKLSELQITKDLLAQTKDTYKKSQFSNQSKKENLAVLLEQTKGEEAKYQQLLASLDEQKKSYVTDISTLSDEKRAEAERRVAEQKRLAAEEERRRKEQGNGGTIGGGGTYPGYNGPCGVNVSYEYDGIPAGYFSNPIQLSYITNGFGCAPGPTGAHDGADVAGPGGDNIIATAEGVVVKAGWRGGYGNAVTIKHNLPSGRVIYSSYGHMQSQPVVAEGQSVQKGQLIGFRGTTGFSSGNHLHFSLADESWPYTTNSNCNTNYGYSVTLCYNPFTAPFNLFGGYPWLY
jgi:murein DD-endopeptidase MepM/ murein hydrolase activator NlpD